MFMLNRACIELDEVELRQVHLVIHSLILCGLVAAHGSGVIVESLVVLIINVLNITKS